MPKIFTKKISKTKFRVQFTVNIIVGVLLAFFTYEILGLFSDVGNSDLFGWLSLSGADVGASAGLMMLLAVVLGADILWVIFFILWLLKKKLHLENPDNTLRLP
jgi:hypothetical protein